MPKLPRRSASLGLVLLAATWFGPAQAQAPAVALFKLVGPRDEVILGFTPAELDRLGSGPAVERIARALVSAGQVTAWQYMVTRAPDGTTHYATSRRIAVLKNDSLRVEPYSAALPVAPPPAG
jgi:hypothetical protein